MSNEKIEKQIDDTIESICGEIQGMMSHKGEFETSNAPELIEALSKLIFARKARGVQGDDCENDFPSRIDITDEISYEEARAYIQAHSQDISLEEKEKIEELIHFIQTTIQNGIGFAKGCLYRYSGLLNKYQWLYDLTEKLLLQYWI